MVLRGHTMQTDRMTAYNQILNPVGVELGQ